ncbi:16S rRNA (cytosine(967)-C(5))-methyltransferase RsmB [Pseudohongiella spirulinae]|uniref:16S rRNA (cytosine(967)-C(5))-methyltransferase n=1 Tax=Pseudohongiella spirulinae TaxID=1249552 RepID=A0A0S2K8P5_9GAMM|nr:16S rRNA (cytosine(967)-C(5))-methyltransferase RsmB [Pseudohongiella spirulinae]ALO44710.1 Ribosomal RNA small subunit methyltransferase B [Pseudohongiella spirulinae]
MTPAKVRAEAARILTHLISGQQGSLANLMPRGTSADDAQGLPLLQELCFGTCRWFYRLEAQLQNFLDKPLKKKDADIHCLLLIGLYQLEYLRLPAYAAINETVNAAVVLKKVWAKRLINAVLRRYQRSRDEKQNSAAPPHNTAEQYAFPAWLADALQQAWPEHYPHVLDQSNQHPPMTLRVNQQHISAADYLLELEQAGFSGQVGKFSETAVYLDRAVAVSALPGFADGWVSVQDEASQLIPGLLQLLPGLSVLDACAAPGGKTCHILENQPRLASITAVDIEERRLNRLHQNVQRLRLPEHALRVKAADATKPDQWWDGSPFDRVLLDAPCSASGIIRRQPDIKLLRRAEDIPRLAALQARLLDSLWSTLAPGGLMLYTTCSILPAENTLQIAAFLHRTPDATEIPISGEGSSGRWGIQCLHGRQLLPENHGPDGFFYALLQKAADQPQ